jgi:hypothetical protein
LGEPCSFFIPEDAVADMAQEVQNKRLAHPDHPLADHQDAVLPGLKLPNHVFDGCMESFFAAKESNWKADSQIQVSWLLFVIMIMLSLWSIFMMLERNSIMH